MYLENISYPISSIVTAKTQVNKCLKGPLNKWPNHKRTLTFDLKLQNLLPVNEADISVLTYSWCHLNSLWWFLLNYFFLSDCDSFAMMVDSPSLPLLTGVSPQAVHVGVEQHQQEGHQKVEDQPDVDHLHIGSGGQVVADADEHCCQDQHGGEVYCYYCFKEKVLQFILL